jgi:transcription initiation factor TFIIB
MYNKLNFKNKCPECNSNIIYDEVKGEFICCTCGYVLEEHIEEHVINSFNNSHNKNNNSNIGKLSSVSYHDFGLHTEIDHNGKDYTGRGLDDHVKKTIANLRKWNTIIRISNSKERRLSTVLSKIIEICSTGSFPNVVCETAAILYRIYENKSDTKGKSSICMASASIFYACKICSIIRSLNEIVRVCSSDDDYGANLKLSSKYYKSMILVCSSDLDEEKSIESQHNKLNNAQIKDIDNNKLEQFYHKSNDKINVNSRISNIQNVGISQYISKLANLSNFDTKIERLALEIAKKTENHLLSDGKSPNGIAAAYLYISSILLGVNILQMDISKLAGVTEVTIRNRCKDILTNYKITLRVKPMSMDH